VPAELAPGLALAAIPSRADVRDALVSRDGAALADLPIGARVGTTSLRRICQVKELRPDLRLEPLRGNLDTRLRKVADGQVDAAILACAGLDRLGLSQRIAERIPIERMLPAIGQGALAIETRADDEPVRGLCRALASEDAEITVTAERTLLQDTWGLGVARPWQESPRCSKGDLKCGAWWGLPTERPCCASMSPDRPVCRPSPGRGTGRRPCLRAALDRILAEFH
jgi:porphobilinogen deaminase